MAQEIEAKYRLDDPAALRARLRDCGGRRLAHVLETNRIFDTADRKLLTADCGLRLRTGRSLDDAQVIAATLTYKGSRAPGPQKRREEIETAVTDVSAVTVILERLGFHEVLVYEKRRETWRLDACEVCLDELPRLGWFAEIEGPRLATVDATSARLGLGAREPLRETYAELTAAHGTCDSGGARRLLFGAGPTD
jgi:predicted adenylyl cyclase CyaB